MRQGRRIITPVIVSLAITTLIAFILVVTNTSILEAWGNDPTVNTPVDQLAGDDQYPKVVTDAAGNVFVGWIEWPAWGLNLMHVQKMDQEGNLLWGANGVPASPILGGVYESFAIVPDEAGGVYAVYRTPSIDMNNDGDISDDGEYFGIYQLLVMRLDADGDPAWLAPIRVADVDHDMSDPAAASDGEGGIIIGWLSDYYVWHVFRDPNVVVAAAQRIDAAGNRLWGAVGSLIFEPWDEFGDTSFGSISGNTSPIGAVTDGAGGAFVAWSFYDYDDPDYTVAQVQVMRIDHNGNRLFGAYNTPGTFAGTVYQSNPPDFKMVSDGMDGAILFWQSNNWTDFNVHAQRVDNTATVVWQAGGLPICDVAGTQGSVIGATERGIDVVADGLGGAFFVWEDERLSHDYVTPYAQKVTPVGDIVWDEDGIPVPISRTFTQSAPRVGLDGQGGILVIWLFYYNLYAQRIDGTGVPVWAADLPVSTHAVGGRSYPELASDGSGNAIAVWQDTRNSITQETDIYAQGFNRDGELGAMPPPPEPTATPTAEPTQVPGLTGIGLGVLAGSILVISFMFGWRPGILKRRARI